MRHLLGLCCTALLCSTGFAADTAAIDALVQKLGSPSYAEREAAGQELLKVGLSALPAVKAAAENNADPEIRERAAALVEPLSKTFDSSKLLAVKSIKIEYKAVPLAAVIEDLKTKTGILLTLVTGKVADRSRPVTVPAGEYAPWEAVDVVIKASGLREDHRAEFPAPTAPVTGQRGMGRFNRWDYDDGQVQNNYTPSTSPILLVDGVDESLPAVRTGGVRVLALPPNFISNRVIRGAGRVIFHLDVAPVPSLGWSVAHGVRITAAEDEDGRPLFSDLKLQSDPMANSYDPWGGGRWGGGRRVFWGGGGMFQQSYYSGGGGTGNDNPRLLAVAIRTNDRSTTMLKKFEGVVLGDVHTANVPVITIENLPKAVGTISSGPQQSNLTIQDVKKQDNGSHTVKFKYESLTQWALMQAGGGGGGNFIGNPDNPSEMLTRCKFYDADGKVLTNPNQDSTSSSGDGFRQTMEVTLRFTKEAKAPVKMVVTGTKVTSVEVPFKMINVRIP
ncbi:hypothetical protein BH11PLA2_BH11PLA2_36250 [soil metagenome]